MIDAEEGERGRGSPFSYWLSSHGILLDDNLTSNLNHKIRFRQDSLEIICTKQLLIVLM